MDNIIYIWAINRVFEFCNSITPVCIAISVGAFLVMLVCAFGSLDAELNEHERKTFLEVKCWGRKWLGYFIVIAFLSGLAGKFKLDKTEFKLVAVYCIGKDIIQSKQGEKVISIIDNKLDEWLKKIEK